MICGSLPLEMKYDLPLERRRFIGKGRLVVSGERKVAVGPSVEGSRWSLMSEGNEGKSSGGSGRLSMKELIFGGLVEDCSGSVEDCGSERGTVGRPNLSPFELESVNSKVEGTVEGASSCNSRLEVTREFQTSALKAPSE